MRVSGDGGRRGWQVRVAGVGGVYVYDNRQ